MKIEVYKPKYRVEECICELRECLVKSWTGMGYKTTEFEEMWKEYTGLNNALFLNSGSSALFLAVNALKLRNNWNYRSEVISTPNNLDCF